MDNNKENLISEIVDKTIGPINKEELNEGLFDGIKAIGAGVKNAFTGIGTAYKSGKVTHEIQTKINEMRKSIDKIDQTFEQQVNTFAQTNGLMNSIEKDISDPVVRQEIKKVLQSIDFFNASLKKILDDYKEAMNNIPQETNQPENDQQPENNPNDQTDTDWEDLIASIKV